MSEGTIHRPVVRGVLTLGLQMHYGSGVLIVALLAVAVVCKGCLTLLEVCWSRLSFAGQKSREQELLFAHIPGFRRPDASSVPLRSGQSRAAERVWGSL